MPVVMLVTTEGAPVFYDDPIHTTEAGPIFFLTPTSALPRSLYPVLPNLFKIQRFFRLSE